MNFKGYDILSALVPGFLMLISLQKFLGQSFDKDYVVPYTAIAFLLGYLMNTLGSWLEGFYFLTWGGKPSDCLLDGKNIAKVKMYHSAVLKSSLKLKTTNQNPTNDELFAIAMRSAIGEKDTRVDDFNAIYAFSRTLLTTSILGGTAILIQYHNDWRYFLIIIPIIIILWVRCKQRGYYFAKEILNVYSKKEQI